MPVDALLPVHEKSSLLGTQTSQLGTIKRDAVYGIPCIAYYEVCCKAK